MSNREKKVEIAGGHVEVEPYSGGAIHLEVYHYEPQQGGWVDEQAKVFMNAEQVRELRDILSEVLGEER